jgi:hypothetical protein
MATMPRVMTESAQRRVVLIDFDWQDSDLLPALLRQPGLSVRLVAGERPDEAGLRMAEICSLPRTLDLADLTREIFDCALVSERSPRRTQIEGLLLALGTPCFSPRSFLDGQPPAEESTPAIEAPLALHAAAFETAIGGQDFSSLVEQALDDLGSDAPTAPLPVVPSGTPGFSIGTLDDFPSVEDRHALELALSQLVANTGAGSAELHVGHLQSIALVAQAGTHDPLLRGLVDLALELNAPQILKRLSAPNEGRMWGAWPFRTIQRRGVLAAAAIDPKDGVSPWEKMVEELRTTWDEQEREKAAPGFPLMAEAQKCWLDRDAFRSRLKLAVERNRHDGLRFGLHRLEFAGHEGAVERLCRRLPDQLRDTDSVCQPTPREVLLLTAMPASAFAHVRRRLLGLWEHAWHEAGEPPPAPPITDLRVEMVGPEDADGFLTAAEAWLTGM